MSYNILRRNNTQNGLRRRERPEKRVRVGDLVSVVILSFLDIHSFIRLDGKYFCYMRLHKESSVVPDRVGPFNLYYLVDLTRYYAKL